MEDKRLVSSDRGFMLAEQHKIKFFETSAKENVNIDLVVRTVGYLTNILQLRNKKASQ